MNINKYFDKIYCMNLDHRIDRWQECINQFKKHKIIVDRFPAFYGEKIYKGQKTIKPAEFGCLFTHLSILLDAREKGYSKILIFEDDVELHDNFNELFEKVINQVPPDWDMLYLGANRVRSREAEMSENVSLAFELLGGHAYAVSSQAYNFLINLLVESNLPVDDAYARNQFKLNTFLARPLIAWQRSGYSDIFGGTVNYDFLKEGSK